MSSQPLARSAPIPCSCLILGEKKKKLSERKGCEELCLEPLHLGSGAAQASPWSLPEEWWRRVGASVGTLFI